MKCDPCLSGDVHSAAKGFCKTCEDPEPLCDTCAHLHTRQKATKHHEICNDLTKFLSSQKRYEYLKIILIFTFFYGVCLSTGAFLSDARNKDDFFIRMNENLV